MSDNKQHQISVCALAKSVKFAAGSGLWFLRQQRQLAFGDSIANSFEYRELFSAYSERRLIAMSTNRF